MCSGHNMWFHLSTSVSDTGCPNKYSLNYAWSACKNIQRSSSELLLLPPNFNQNWSRWTNFIKDHWHEHQLKSVQQFFSCYTWIDMVTLIGAIIQLFVTNVPELIILQMWKKKIQMGIPFFWDMMLHQQVTGSQCFEGNQCPWNIGIWLPVDRASYPKRMETSATLLQKPQNSHEI